MPIAILRRFFVLFFLLSVCSFAADNPPPREQQLADSMHSISSHTLFSWLEELCGESYQGRLSGTPGYDAAARWAVARFNEWGLRPAGERNTFLQTFANPYTLVLPGAGLELLLPAGKNFQVRKAYRLEDDFFPGGTADSGTLTAEVVFAGYGITAPEIGYDDYAGLNVKGKIVLLEPEVPVSAGEQPAEFKKWRPYSFHDYKMQNARDHGAAGVLYHYPITNPNCRFIPGLLVLYVGDTVVTDLFGGSGREYGEVVKKIAATRKPQSFASGKTVTMRCATEHHPEGSTANVIALLEGSDPQWKNEYIVVGAHLDFVGRNPLLLPGANDNASGVVVTLGVAKALAALPARPKRSVLFVLFAAEEQGVAGSNHFLQHPPVPLERIKAFINFDGVGVGEKIAVGGGVNYPQVWNYFLDINRRFVRREMRPFFSHNLARPRLDAAHFMWAGIPSLSFSVYGDKPLPYPIYHNSKDHPREINPEILEDLAQLVLGAVAEMADGELKRP